MKRRMKRSDFETYEFIGMGAEGSVYKINDNLVAKCWYRDNIVTGLPNDCRGIIDRYQRIAQKIIDRYQRIAQKIPNDLRDVVKVPEVAGYEVGEDGTVITYHEFIDGNPITIDDPLVTVYERLQDVFWDLGGENTRTKDGKVYLIDAQI